MNTSPESVEKAKQFIAHDPALFELLVLAAYIKMPAAKAALDGALCVHHKTHHTVSDFDDPVHFQLYKLYRYYLNMAEEASTSADKVLVPTSEDIRLCAQMLSFEGDTGPLELIDEIVPVAADIAAPDFASTELLEGLVLPALSIWLTNKRTQAAIVDIKRSGFDPDIADKVVELEEIKDLCSLTDSESLFEEFGNQSTGEKFIERMPLGANFRGLNSCLGGGIGKKEHIIFAAPTGQGKTILACQLAADLATSGHQVLFVTTEQPANELEPRVYSCLSKGPGMTPIPFSILKDGGYMDTVSDMQKKTLATIRERLSGKLVFQSWVGKGKSINDLDTIIKLYIKQYGRIDAVFLDWIGGSLTEGVDPKYKRDAYLDAAKKMKNLAYKYDVATISFAQTTQDSIDKQRVSEKYLAECKTLHTEAAAAFGISAMRTAGAPTDGSSDSAQNAYAEEQYVYCFKSRKSAGQLLSTKRDFGFQRFTGM